MAGTLKYVGPAPQFDVRPTQSQDLVDQSYVAFLLAQNMTMSQVTAQINAQLSQYATKSQADSAMTPLATPSWIQGQVSGYVPASQINQPNGPVGLGEESDLVSTSLINAPSTQTWPKPFWSPGTYPTGAVAVTTTPQQLLSMSIPDPGYPYVLMCLGAFDTQVSLPAIETFTVTITATSGTYILNYNGQTTTSLAYNAAASTIQTALRALSTVSTATVTGSAGSYTLLITPKTPGLLSASSNLSGGTITIGGQGDDGTSAQVGIYQGGVTGPLIAAGVGSSQSYGGPTPGDASSQMFINSSTITTATWTTIPNWLPQNGNGYTSTVIGNYLQVPETMAAATISAVITYSGAAGSGAKGAAAMVIEFAIVDSNGNQLITSTDSVAADTTTVSWTGPVVAGQLYTVQVAELNAAAYATITAGTLTITPSQIPTTSPATIIPVSFTNQLPITGPTTVVAMLASSNNSTQVTATTLDPGLWVMPIPWAGGNPSTPVAFDNAGAGQFGGSATTNYSYSHTATGGALVIVDVVVDRASSVQTITYGGTPMKPMTSVFFPGATGNAAIYRYYLANVVAGAATVAITLNAGAWCASCSFSYLNVLNFTYSTTSANSSTTLSQSATLNTTGALLLQSFGCPVYALASPTGGTVRFNNGSHAYLLTQEAASSTTFGATCATAQGWGGVQTVLLP